MRTHGIYNGRNVLCEDLYRCFGLVLRVEDALSPYYCPFCAASRHDPIVATQTLQSAGFAFDAESDWLTPRRFTDYIGLYPPTLRLQDQIPTLATIRDIRYMWAQGPTGNWYLRSLINVGQTTTETPAQRYTLSTLGGDNTTTIWAPDAGMIQPMAPPGFDPLVGIGGGVAPPPSRRQAAGLDADFLACHCNRCG